MKGKIDTMAAISRLLIALPTTSQSMKSSTALTIANLVKLLQSHGIDAYLHNIDSAEIVTARDMFANMVVYSDDLDGLIFIDSDMAFDPEIMMKMLRTGKDVVAAACTRRTLNLSTLLSAAQQHGNVPRAIAQASDFTVKLSWNDNDKAPVEVTDGFCRAAAVGMACAYISKGALMAMVKAKAVEPRLDLSAGPGQTCWSFFAPVAPDGVRLGEDYSFCYRWTKTMRRELFVCVDEAIIHCGDYNYTARFIDLFEQTPAA
ncbi:MAG TPA: hypothetical protein VF662_00055 [Allosphingosinicella sp.]